MGHFQEVFELFFEFQMHKVKKPVHGPKHTKYEVWAELVIIFGCRREAKILRKKCKKKLKNTKNTSRKIFFQEQIVLM